jgi:hypothetical protein
MEDEKSRAIYFFSQVFHCFEENLLKFQCKIAIMCHSNFKTRAPSCVKKCAEKV